MKKCLPLLLALCLTLSLAACGGKTDTNADADDSSQTQDNTPAEAPAGEPVELTFKEYALLHLFLEHPEEVLARERIMKDVWDTDDLLESRTIDMHVRSLRQKLGAAGEAIRTVRKVGYKLSTEGSDD